jgi:hypothetical protein
VQLRVPVHGSSYCNVPYVVEHEELKQCFIFPLSTPRLLSVTDVNNEQKKIEIENECDTMVTEAT